MAALRPLEEAALRMFKAGPDQFRMFVEQFEKAYALAQDELSRAPAAEIMVVQGRVQAYQHMLRVFKECTVERI